MLTGAHKKFERRQHTEMYLPALKAEDEGKIELSPAPMASFHSVGIQYLPDHFIHAGINCLSIFFV